MDAQQEADIELKIYERELQRLQEIIETQAETIKAKDMMILSLQQSIADRDADWERHLGWGGYI